MQPLLRFRLRTMIFAVAVAVVVVALLLAYVGGYYRLSRGGLREGVPYGIDGFLYVPVEDYLGGDRKVMDAHHRLMWFYAPVNLIDRQFFRKNYPVTCLMRLSG